MKRAFDGHPRVLTACLRQCMPWICTSPTGAVLPRNRNSLSEALTLDQVHYETVLHNRFGRWRCPNDPGSKYGDFIFEAVPYMDMIMADLGLKVQRKSGWFRELIEPYVPGLC